MLKGPRMGRRTNKYCKFQKKSKNGFDFTSKVLVRMQRKLSACSKKKTSDVSEKVPIIGFVKIRRKTVDQKVNTF